MSRIANAFRKNQKAFIAFLTCGDPDMETTEKLVMTMAESGVDLIELGIPFSDPTAEGPVIQQASLRALAAGTTTDQIFDLVERLRRRTEVPLVVMTYANVVFSYHGDGGQSFIRKAAAAGIDGLILPDVPYEEKSDFMPLCQQYGLDFISLIAPTSQDRIAMIASEAQGFIYCVSSLGVTGVRNHITTDIDTMIDEVRAATHLPVAIGFGIAKPEQAAQMAQKADGIIIGSAIVQLVAQHGRQAIEPVGDYVRCIRTALDTLS